MMKRIGLICFSFLVLAGCASTPKVIDRSPILAEPKYIVINEAASTGTYEFIELFNLSDLPVIFSSGWKLIDNGKNLEDGDVLFSIPEGTRIEGYGHLLICPFTKDRAKEVLNNDQVPQEALCDISFSLGAHDSVNLYYGNILVDTIPWDSDVNSIGRIPDGFREISTELLRTPGTANKKERKTDKSFPIFINEINSRGEDYVELFNGGTTDFSFSKGPWVLEDSKKERTYTIPDSLIIPSGGYLVFQSGSNGFDVKLGNADSIILRYDDAIVDMYTWSEHVHSIGRVPDGSDTWQNITMSPGKTNMIPGKD